MIACVAIPASIAGRLTRTLHGMMTEVFPELGSVKITHGWTGYVAFTFDALPHFGQHDGIHYAMGPEMQIWSWLSLAPMAKLEAVFDESFIFMVSLMLGLQFNI